MNKRTVFLLALVALAGLAFILFIFLRPDAYSEAEKSKYGDAVKNNQATETKNKLTYAVHWTEAFQTEGIYDAEGNLKEKGLKQYLEEYESLNPDVSFDIMIIPYVEYESKIKLLDDIDEVPDIFQAYSPWGASYVEAGIIDTPPMDIKEDVLTNYVSASGATIDEEIWGIPSEINDFALIYNKRIFKEAGIVDENGEAKAPETWEDLLEAAQKTSERDENGNITRYGFAFTKGMDWAVVDPFLSLLLTNGGSYLNEDNSKALFNSPEGVEVLEGIISMFDNSYTDVNSNVWDFNEGKVAMAFIAPWTEGVFQEGMGELFNEEVGVAPVPYFKKPGTLQYSWFLGVMNKSKNKELAWDFLRWFTTDIQEDRGTTRYGDLMARTIKAIPSRLVDMENNKDMLEDNSFKAPFISQLPISTPEPNIPEAAQIKEILRQEIEASWTEKSATEALNDAALKVNELLK